MIDLPATPVAPRRRFERPWAIALFLLAAALALRARDFGNPIIHVDEEYYLLVGDRLLHGARLYLDVWDRKPLGLFAIFAAIRLLPGDGILAYQLVATGFAAATGMVVAVIARQAGARPASALVAGLAYILWLSLLSGRGGQSPVFYNLFVAGAASLTLRLPGLRTPRAIVGNGAAACLLAGLAIQTKYTPAVEGAFFGLAHVWYLHRVRAGWGAMAGAALLWAALGLAPTLLVAAHYRLQGPAAWDAFWFANVTSITLRRGYPAAKIAARLAGTGAQLSPFVVCAVLAWRRTAWTRQKALLFGWLAAALIAFAMIGAFFDHYALPLVAPLAAIAALAFDRWRSAITGVMIAGAGLFVFHVVTKPDRDGAGVRAMARMMAANDAGGCPYVFAGDAILYHLAHACLPTAYAFPSTLAYEAERGATGVDEAGEVRRIMARRPPVVVTLAAPLSPWNAASAAVVRAALRRDYRPAMRVRREEGGAMIAWLRRDLPLRD